MSTTAPTRYQRYRAARRRRLEHHGGKHRHDQITDPCERQIAREEPGVALLRELKLLDLCKVKTTLLLATEVPATSFSLGKYPAAEAGPSAASSSFAQLMAAVHIAVN